MPLTRTGTKVLRAMQDTYGREKGERVFHASITKGKPGSRAWHQTKRTSLAHRTLMRSR